MTSYTPVLIAQGVSPSAFSASYTIDSPGPRPSTISASFSSSFAVCRRDPRMRITVLRSVRWPPKLWRCHGTGGSTMGRYCGMKASTICGGGGREWCGNSLARLPHKPYTSQ